MSGARKHTLRRRAHALQMALERVEPDLPGDHLKERWRRERLLQHSRALARAEKRMGHARENHMGVKIGGG